MLVVLVLLAGHAASVRPGIRAPIDRDCLSTNAVALHAPGNHYLLIARIAAEPTIGHSLHRSAAMRPSTPKGGDMTLASRSNETAPVTPTHRDIHRNWTREEALALYEAPFNDLLFQA